MRPRAAKGGVLIALENAPTKGEATAPAPDACYAGRAKPWGRPLLWQPQPFLQPQQELEP